MTAAWGPEGPPEEAYSRVTNPERFGLLHDVAKELLAQLENDFDVERTAVREPADDFALEGKDRQTVMLKPRNPDSAPLLVTFTEFPGIVVRFGLRHRRAFPSCGCDACAETAEGEAALLREEVAEMITSRYAERISIPFTGKARVLDRFDWPGRASWSSGDMDRAEARMLEAEGRASREWQPWARRGD